MQLGTLGHGSGAGKQHRAPGGLGIAALASRWRETAGEVICFKCFMRAKCRKWNSLNFKYISHIGIRVTVVGDPVLLCTAETLHPEIPRNLYEACAWSTGCCRISGVCVLETKLQHWRKTHPSPLNLMKPVVSIQRPDTLLAAPNSTLSGHQCE